MPMLMAEGSGPGCCRLCDAVGDLCAYGYSCVCHMPDPPKSPPSEEERLETSLASLNAAARDRHPWDFDPDPDGGSF